MHFDFYLFRLTCAIFQHFLAASTLLSPEGSAAPLNRQHFPSHSLTHTPRDLCSALPTTPSSRLRPQTRTQTTPTILARPRALDTCTSPSTTWTTKCHAVTRSIPKAGLEDARLPLNIRRLDDRPTTTTHTRSNLTDNNDNSTHNRSHHPRPSLWQ